MVVAIGKNWQTCEIGRAMLAAAHEGDSWQVMEPKDILAAAGSI
jgi:hypothetical protein